MAKITTKKKSSPVSKQKESSPKKANSKNIKSIEDTDNSFPHLLNVIIKGMQEKKAQDITIVNLKKLKTGMADYFVICSAGTDNQVDAIFGSIEEEVWKNLKMHPWKKEGYQNKEWILLDYSDIVVHIFRSDKREFYSLEELWGDADIKNLRENDIVYLPGEKSINAIKNPISKKAKAQKTSTEKSKSNKKPAAAKSRTATPKSAKPTKVTKTKSSSVKKNSTSPSAKKSSDKGGAKKSNTKVAPKKSGKETKKTKK